MHACTNIHFLLQLLGFPIQLLGLIMLPYLVVRYYVDGADLAKDAGEAVVRSGLTSLV